MLGYHIRAWEVIMIFIRIILVILAIMVFIVVIFGRVIKVIWGFSYILLWLIQLLHFLCLLWLLGLLMLYGN